ncbi:MAG: histidine--tRNA ligase [Candidatus Liptonbacteria bacterium RIFCSPLOWO2_12_FULL_60_15]|uniref:Histidine--tRNA ligase n=1 Tax=Candidatus Liptonbacteria bacterium RIFCSPLOWO2_12_FULL_60_15 TaxID=1798653 RepID=A0A1G2CNC0_9BACT|nr:MAG: histidine--tRNA ligase [Candidatus Liptonbacteria bacterium RIFCSPLOWO2_12_FULL_60_15]
MALPTSKQKQEKKRAKTTTFQAPKGMHDILPNEEAVWERLRKAAREIADDYNFSRIETTILEHAEVFERTLGETSDVVEKEMFAVKTRGGDRLVLRPEGTAPLVRAYLEHGMSHLSQPLKLFYVGPMFRHEQPQAGRFRQFHQIGFEILGGESDPIYDAQIIVVAVRLLEELKIKNLSIRINSIGCRVCRPLYRKKLTDHYRGKEKQLCRDCERRLETNPLRLLDCKNENCQKFKADAPSFLDNLCHLCNVHFKGVLEYIDELGLPYVLDPRLVRGLDYYNRTVFEIYAEGFDFALQAGGRYDYLVETLGGKPTPAVGGAAGIERLIHVMKERDLLPPARPKNKVFLVYVGDLAKRRCLKLLEQFRNAGIPLGEALGKGSLDTQLRIANKNQAPVALIFGQKEAYEDSIIVRDMKTGAQETVPIARAPQTIQKKLKEQKAMGLQDLVVRERTEEEKAKEAFLLRKAAARKDDPALGGGLAESDSASASDNPPAGGAVPGASLPGQGAGESQE